MGGQLHSDASSYNVSEYSLLRTFQTITLARLQVELVCQNETKEPVDVGVGLRPTNQAKTTTIIGGVLITEFLHVLIIHFNHHVSHTKNMMQVGEVVMVMRRDLCSRVRLPSEPLSNCFTIVVYDSKVVLQAVIQLVQLCIHKLQSLTVK